MRDRSLTIRQSTQSGVGRVVGSESLLELGKGAPGRVSVVGAYVSGRSRTGCCRNLADGKRAWKEGRYGRGQVLLLQEQNALRVSSETGELILLATDPGGLKELGRFQAFEGKTWNHSVVRLNRVYLRNAQEIACYALSTKATSLSQLGARFQNHFAGPAASRSSSWIWPSSRSVSSTSISAAPGPK